MWNQKNLIWRATDNTVTTINSYQAYAISAIAHWDWPEAWPDLFGHLMQALTSGDGNLVHGAMRVLTGIKSTLCYLDTVEVLLLLCFVSMAKRIPGIKIPIDRIKKEMGKYTVVLLWVVAENWQSQGKAYILFVFCCWMNTNSLLVHVTWICLFSEFCREVTDIQIPHVAPVILPEMYKIFIHAEVRCIHGYHVMCLCIMMKKKL